VSGPVSLVTQSSEEPVIGKSFSSLSSRASEWSAAPTSCCFSFIHFSEVGAFAPLAGARLMLTCRARFPVFLRFSQSLRDLGSVINLGRNVYERRLREIKWTADLRCPPTTFADSIAVGVEGGADSDLVFALLQRQMGVMDVSIAEGDLCRGFAFGEVSTYATSPLYSACGPRGHEAVVSLLIKVGLPVDELGRDKSQEFDCNAPQRTALYRALLYNRLSTVKTLLRSGASVGLRCGEWGDTYCGLPNVEAPIWLALTMAQRPYRGGDGALKMLLEHRVCPGKTAQESRLITCDLWHKSDSSSSSILKRVFYNCEQRCCCEVCESRWVCLDRIAKKRRERDLSP
jgi:hypothetical protein